MGWERRNTTQPQNYGYVGSKKHFMGIGMK